MKKPIGWFGWLWRGVAVTVGAIVTLFAAAVAYQLFVVQPQAREKADAFARLTGPARRLAIYDAFTDAVDRYYYDQAFSGFDWPKMKREWRVKAAAPPDDTRLYTDVFFQMAQRFPVSHIGANIPPPAGASVSGARDAQPAPMRFSDRDPGFQVAVLRRGKNTILEVGEVWPGSLAARAGIQPGSIFQKFSENAETDKGHFSADLLCLTPAESEAVEAHGATEVAGKGTACQTGRDPRRLHVDYDFPMTGAPPDIVTRRLPSGALYIRFDAFQDPVIDKVVKALKTADGHGVVLDLRFNSGGYPLRILQAFLGSHEPAYHVRDARGVHILSTPDGGAPYAGPVVVLTGTSSASAAEITAGVLQSRHRAKLVGRPTNGSVLGAQMVSLPDGGTAEIANQNIETTEGKRLEGVGVMPDILVYPDVAQLRAGDDPALDRADALLRRP